MRSRGFQIIIIAIVAIVAMGAYASDQVDATVYNSAYTAPKAFETHKPQRVFYTPAREVEGYVTVAMLVGEDGTVENAKVLYRTSSLAVNNAVDAVSNWKFEPATLDGKPVKAWIAYNLPFGLDLEIYEETSYTQKVVVNGETLALGK